MQLKTNINLKFMKNYLLLPGLEPSSIWILQFIWNVIILPVYSDVLILFVYVKLYLLAIKEQMLIKKIMKRVKGSFIFK